MSIWMPKKTKHMGQAKRRGTFEERKAQAIASNEERRLKEAARLKEKLDAMTPEEREDWKHKSASLGRVMMATSMLAAMGAPEQPFRAKKYRRKY